MGGSAGKTMRRECSKDRFFSALLITAQCLLRTETVSDYTQYSFSLSTPVLSGRHG